MVSVSDGVLLFLLVDVVLRLADVSVRADRCL